MDDQHAVFATTWQHERRRVSEEPVDYHEALSDWQELEELRLAGRLPHVKHFEVRAMSDAGYRDAPRSRAHRRPALAGRGFADDNPNGRGNPRTAAEKAARRAWKHYAPTYEGRQRWSSGIQGLGGWYYWPSGSTAAQGLDGLATLCKHRGMIAEGRDGRWYALELEPQKVGA